MCPNGYVSREEAATDPQYAEITLERPCAYGQSAMTQALRCSQFFFQAGCKSVIVEICSSAAVTSTKSPSETIVRTRCISRAQYHGQQEIVCHYGTIFVTKENKII